MIIRDMAARECREVMTRSDLGRLGCAHDNQPYVVPIYFAYETDRLYSFTTVGRKIEWMRANPKVCVEVDEIASHIQWMSVIITGRYQELPDTPELSAERLHALLRLERHLLWWRTAYAARDLSTRHKNADPLFYCIHIDSMTGHRAVPEAGDAASGLVDQ